MTTILLKMTFLCIRASIQFWRGFCNHVRIIPNDRRTTLELNKRTFKQQGDAFKIGQQLPDLEGFCLVMKKTTKPRGSHTKCQNKMNHSKIAN